jgi:hypothetical protein
VAVSALKDSETSVLKCAKICIHSLNESVITLLQGNLDCAGSIAINGSNARFTSTAVDEASKPNIVTVKNDN